MKTLIYFLGLLSIIFFANSCDFEGVCYGFHKCFDGTSCIGTFNSNGFFEEKSCYCSCDDDACGEYCQIKKSDCKGELRTSSGSFEGRCFCSCPKIGGVHLSPPECSSSKVFFKLIGLNKKITEDTLDYFPLHESSSWTYNVIDSVGNTTGMFINKIETTFTRGDTIFKPLLNILPDSTGMPTDTIQGLMLFELKPEINTIYTYEDGMSSLFLFHQLTEGDTLIVDGDTLFLHLEELVEVPAGSFENCIKVTDSSLSGYIMAPEIGIIKVLGIGGNCLAELKEYESFCDIRINLFSVPASCQSASDGQVLIELYSAEGSSDSINSFNITWAGPIVPNDPVNPTNLAPGYYNLTITNGICEANIDSLLITAPDPIELTLSDIQNTSCNSSSDGSANISISGGTGPLSLSLDGTEIAEGTLNGLPAGSYSIVAIDSLGCMSTEELIIEANDAIISEALNMHVSCFGSNDGSIDPRIQGGVPPYSYSWSNSSTSAIQESLSGGEYMLTVTDSNACQAEFSYSLQEPEVLLASGLVSNLNCQGDNSGNIDLTVTGGTMPYTYIWSTGSSEEDLNGLAKGDYSITITDSNNCKHEIAFSITEPEALSLSEILTLPLCHDSGDGLLSVSVSGGTAPYDYSWSTGSDAEIINGLGSGIYGLTVTDANDCSESIEFNITPPEALAVLAQTSDEQCFQSANGNIILSTTGGTSPYTYIWNTGDLTKDLEDLTKGNYTVTITDANNCSIVEDYIIAGPEQILVSGQSINVSCHNGSDGSINVFIEGGTPPYQFSWDNGSTTEDLFDIPEGNYSLTITDANDCQEIRLYSITQASNIELDYSSINPMCHGGLNGQIQLDVQGGTPPYTYIWNNGESTKNINNLSVGEYSVTITDNNDCSRVTSIDLTEPGEITAVEMIKDVQCFGMSNGEIELNVSGGTPPFSYLWNTGNEEQILQDISKGDYIITITDAVGCNASYSFTVKEPEEIVLNLSSTNASTNTADGTATVTIEGGIPPYTILWDDTDMQNTETAQGLTVGFYSVTVTDVNGCEQSGEVEIMMSTSTLQLNILEQISFYPNPVSTDLTILNQSSYTFESVKLYSISGLLHETNPLLMNNTIQLPLVEFPSGLYLVEVSFIGNIKIQKMILKI